MYLKYVEIQGFKSFPDKTRLNFERVLTGVVGPNGSGKSNISDAVRWVLGEQSSKSLRGGKMEDVIFGGTALRKPMGFAQVSLCLDNSDGRIADVGNEIVVTRRYYRSGDSEYAVNGSPVRLRDLREMFMDTGLGRDGYSIIGQGRIAEVVECKSTDRREVFEEASGIAKYRFRKNEAQRKLDYAEDNLSRLRDIAGELEARLGPLEEQSRKAKRFLELADERKKMEITLYSDTINRSRESLRTQDEKIEISRLDYAGIEEKLQDYFRQIEKLYEDNALMSAQSEENTAAIRDKNELITATESKVAVLKNDVMHGERSIQTLKDDKGALSKDGSAVRDEIERRRAEAQQKLAQADEIGRGIDELTAEMEALIASSEQTDERRASTARRLAEVQNEISELRVQIVASTSVLETLASREEVIAEALPPQLERMKQCESTLKETEEYCETLLRECQSRENEAQGYALKINSRTESRQKLTDKLSAADSEAERLKQRIAVLEELERNNEGFMPPVRRVLQAKEKGELGGIIGTVGSILQVNSGCELAIETALGAAVQNIVVENERAAKEAIAFLKESKIGRATFLPLDTVRATRFDYADRLSDDGVVGLASELVSCDKKYKTVVENLLGRTIIAEDINYASATARRANHRVRIVTKDGQVINAGGSFTGGFTSRQAGVFSRRGEIEKIEKQIENLTSSTAEDRAAEEKLSAEITRLTAQQTAVLSELTTIREDRIRAEAELSRQRAELEALRANSAAAEDEKVKILSQRNERQTEIARCESREAMLSEDVARLQAALSAEDSADGFMQRRAELMESITARRISRAELIKDAEQLEEMARQLTLRDSEVLDRAANLDSAIAVIEAENEQRRGEIDELSAQLAALRNEIEALREQTSDYTAKRAQNEQQVIAARAAQDELTEQRERIAAEISRLEERKTALEKDYNSSITHLWEEYELTPGEAAPLCVPFNSITELRSQVASVRAKIRALGSVNVDAIDEFEQVKERYAFQSAQIEDMERSRTQLLDLIDRLEGEMKQIFTTSFNEINSRFHRTFTELFGGGSANLYLTDENDILGSGIELDVQPPGKLIKNLSALSGGEKALVAIAIYMAILEVNPSPFCILDEIDSALDESNVVRFVQYLKKLITTTQLIVITHRRGTMDESDVLYGVTMQEDGVSKVLHISVDEAHVIVDGEKTKK